jgi:50S ribosomal subunit-associated GTPase HflX
MEDGEYKFDPSKLKQAHSWCQNEVHNAMILNVTTGEHSDIAVSNTFTQEWEMEPYMELAKSWGYRVFSIVVENRHEGVNQHNVPEDKLQAMKDRFEFKL